MTDEDRFEEWDKIYFNQTEKDDMKDAYLAGLAEGRRLERERCYDLAMECSATTPRSIGKNHGRHHSAGCQRVAAAIRGKETP